MSCQCWLWFESWQRTLLRLVGVVCLLPARRDHLAAEAGAKEGAPQLLALLAELLHGDEYARSVEAAGNDLTLRCDHAFSLIRIRVVRDRRSVTVTPLAFHSTVTR